MQERKRQLVGLYYTCCHLAPELLMHELSQPYKQVLLKAEDELGCESFSS